MFKRFTALNSIALRLSAMFALVALLVFVLIGGALYQQVDKSIGRLPEALERDLRADGLALLFGQRVGHVRGNEPGGHGVRRDAARR